MTYHTERINDESYPVIRELYRRSFGVVEPLSFFKIKYDTAGFGLKNIGVLAKSGNNDPAAYYGVFPIIMTYHSKDFLVAQSGDTMTAPEHRNKGLFVTLAQQTYQLAGKEGILLIYGFPNSNSYPGFQKKLNWTFNGSMQQFSLTNLTIPLCEIATKWKAFGPFYQNYVGRVLSKYKIEVNEANISGFNLNTTGACIKKDLNFFKYKLSNFDNWFIKINSFTMLVKPKGHLIIGAVGYFDESKVDEFIRVVKKLAVKLGCRKAIFTLSPNHWLTHYLVKILQPEESLPIGFYLFNDQFDVKDIEFVRADYDTF